jgi:hypothetical protein
MAVKKPVGDNARKECAALPQDLLNVPLFRRAVVGSNDSTGI